MTYTSFGYGSIFDHGQTLLKLPPTADTIRMPDFVAGNAQWNEEGKVITDKYLMTYQLNGDNLTVHAAGPSLVKLHDVVVKRSCMGVKLWPIMLDSTVMAEETYHSTPLIMRHLGLDQDLSVGKSTASVRLIEPIDIQATVHQPRILLNHHWMDNYSHTWMETASRFWCDSYLNPSHQFVYNPERPWHDEIIGSLGKKLVAQESEAVLYSTLYVPSFAAPCGFSRFQVEFLQDEYDHFAKTYGRRKIYISREDTGSRRVANDAEVWAYLESEGFERVVLSRMTVAQQADLFGSSAMIVAPHGAGLTNVIFTTNASVIECVPDKYQHPMFMFLTRFASPDNWYGRIVCPTGDNDDMTIDIDVLRDAIKAGAQ